MSLKETEQYHPYSVAQQLLHQDVGVKWAAGSATTDLYLIKADPEVLGPQTRPKVHLLTTQPCGCPHVDPDLNPIEQIFGEKNISVYHGYGAWSWSL